MSQDEDYTVDSLIKSLDSIRDPVDSIAQKAFELSKGWGLKDQAEDQADAYHGLWRELHDLSMALEVCLTRLRSSPPSKKARQAALQGPPPILDSCRILVESLTAASLDTLSLDTILETKSKALWLQRTISNGSSWTDNQNGLLFYLSLLPPKPSRDFQAIGIPAAEIRRWRSLRRQNASQDVDADTASYWLMLLNADFNDREPEEYHIERIFNELRHQAVPDYVKAAAQWPLHANKFWSTLRPQIFSLFNSSNSFNFVQWVLAFARGTWPSIFGPEASSTLPLIHLTDGLCSGAVSPLHVAASLGLPELCRDLLSSGSDINQSGALGTPILCALLGQTAFKERFDDGLWACPSDPLTYANQERAETILLLLDAGADCRTSSYTWLANKASIAGPAFWAALAMQNEAIFRRIREAGAQLDPVFEQIMQYPEVETRCFQHKEFSSRLFTHIFDLYLYLKKDIGMSEGDFGAIQGVMQRQKLHFTCGDGEGRIEGVSDQDLRSLTDEIMLIKWAFGLRRLVMDPRFDPNGPPNEYTEGDTCLHYAVSADAHEMVDVLVNAGADLTTQGSEGRTPVMLIESTGMLGKLVQYGAITTDVDQDGRNIWHYAAATNDMPLLNWLCDHDPWKDQNIQVKTDVGRTPLAEAFLFIETLPSQPRLMASAEPLTARKLLKECGDSTDLACHTPLTHLAAAWADLELINGLEALGANFRQCDGNGRTALHYLNFAASAEVVERLQELCAGVPIECDEGSTPAETIFHNFRPLLADGHWVLSAHPSCANGLSADAYSLLLNPAATSVLDHRHESFWQRFCADVIGANPIPMPPQPHRTKRITIFHKSITTALNCIVQCGALEDYEQDSGESAVLCFMVDRIKQRFPDKALFDALSGDHSWNVEHFHPFILHVLENSGPSVIQSFCQSPEAAKLLREAVFEQKLDLVKQLCSAGVRISVSHVNAYDGPEEIDFLPLQWAVSNCASREVFDELLKHVTAEQVTEGQFRLFDALRNLERVHEQVEKLEMLLGRGMDPNAPPAQHCQSMLGQAALSGCPEMAHVLLEHGANPRLGILGGNAAICAAKVGDQRTLLEIVQREGPDFPWAALWDPGSGCENILLTAAKQPRYEILEILFVHTNLKSHINDTCAGGSTAAHRAASRSRMKSLRVLIEHGADLLICDSQGQTPLHAACTVTPAQFEGYDAGSPQTVAYLVEKEPRAASIKDKNGKTPLDLAVELGQEEYVAVLKDSAGKDEGEDQ